MLLFLGRAIKFAIQGFFRNFWLSLVTIIILILTLFSVTIVTGINVVAEQAIGSIQDRVDVSVYFKVDAPESEVLAVRDTLLTIPEVQNVTYVSKDEALGKFREQHSDDSVILEAIDQLEDNPLSATIVIKAYSINEYSAIISVLDDPKYTELIEERNFDNNELVINRLADVSDRIEYIGIVVSLIFVIIAILIIFNTIRINIYTHREEIGIMKLVGSSNAFVRMPFIIESFLYAIVAVAITLALIYPLINVVPPQINSFFAGYDLDITSYFQNNLIRLVLLQLLFAIILSAISSSIAIGRYLRV